MLGVADETFKEMELREDEANQEETGRGSNQTCGQSKRDENVGRGKDGDYSERLWSRKDFR